MVADYFNRILICTHRAIGTKSKELAAIDISRVCVDVLCDCERSKCDIVVYPYGEVMLRVLVAQVIENGLDHRRGKFFKPQPKTSPHDGLRNA